MKARKLISIILAFSLILISGITASASNNVTVNVNGTTIEFDQPPIIKNDRVFVPVRAIAEALGADVMWNDDTSQITIMDAVVDNGVSFYIDSISCKSNGVDLLIDAAPFIENGRTMLPLRALSQTLGCLVEWVDSSKTVNITSAPFNIEANYANLAIDSERPIVYNSYYNSIDGEYGGYDWYIVPSININKDNARQLTKQINELLMPIVNETMEAYSNNQYYYCKGVWYDYHIFNDIISILVVVSGDYGETKYYSFNYDISNDKQLTGNDIINLSGINTDAWFNNIKNRCLKSFDIYYPENETIQWASNYYYEERNNIVNGASYNIDTPLYLNESGNIYAIVSIPNLALGYGFLYGIDTGFTLK